MDRAKKQRGRPRKTSLELENETRSIATVATSNEYDILSDTEEVPRNTTTIKQRKVDRVPPIIVCGTSVGDVHCKITSVGVVHYTTNTTTKGIVVSTTNTTDFRKVVDVLKRTSTQFYTHLLDEQKTTKIVLFGLPDYPIEDIQSSLEDLKVKPQAIKKLHIKKKKFDDQMLYLLHFPKGSITLSELKNIRAVNHHRVYFEYYASANGPMQCRNCQKFGHGNANCHLKPVCVKCAGTHTSKSCPLSLTTTSPDGKITPSKLRCANCGDHHTASFQGCPTRASASKPKNVRPKTTQFRFEQANFPCLEKVPKPMPHAMNYSNAVKTQTQNRQFDLNIDISEIGRIVEDVYINLSNCSSKKDLISVIVQITAKYCFGNGK